MTAMPLLLAVLAVMAIAYRYYSAFLAARVMVLDDTVETPAVRFNDGNNYEPTNKWVLFGHHFAAISGAGPLIGPVLAAQFGYMPGLLWIIVGVCLAGAVQDFLIMAASLRRDGKSLARIAFDDIGRVAGIAATAAILFIIVITLAGLGKVVVKALGGESVAYPAASTLVFHDSAPTDRGYGVFGIPPGTELVWDSGKSRMTFAESFDFKLGNTTLTAITSFTSDGLIPAGSARLVPGSAWGTFTIAATIPIALFIGLYLRRLRKNCVIEASILGAALTLGATVLGGWVAQHPIGQWFNLSSMQVTWAMAIYGFVAAVLPVWMLLLPRDYLSSFLKIGTITLLVVGTIVANPKLEAPAFNHVFAGGGPVVAGSLFPFLFITVMCGAISGFHALVATGTTPKMIRREGDARMIGFGAMLLEGLVAVVALIAAATLPPADYYGMNTELGKVPQWHDRILQVGGAGGIEHTGQPATDSLSRYEELTHETLRGRVGGAVTLAVGMAHVFDRAAARFLSDNHGALEAMWRYWYHFAIMFEALFILTTIDAGTRIGRFLLQEVLGRIRPSLGINGKWPAVLLSTGVIVLSWAWFMNSGSFPVIWSLFGIANQTLAVIALAVASAHLAAEGRSRYLWVTALPAAMILTTTSTAAVEMLTIQFNSISTQLANDVAVRNVEQLTNSVVQAALTLAMLGCAAVVLVAAMIKIAMPERISSGR